MKTIIAAALAATALAGPAADAAKFSYSLTVQQLGFGGTPTDDYYSANGIFDADYALNLFGADVWSINSATGKITNSYDSNAVAITGVSAYPNLPGPGFVLLGGTPLAVSFTFQTDGNWLGVGGTAFASQGFYSEVPVRITSLSITPFAGEVPEPAAWVLMILGFGAVGAAMRRRSTVKATIRLA